MWPPHLELHQPLVKVVIIWMQDISDPTFQAKSIFLVLNGNHPTTASRHSLTVSLMEAHNPASHPAPSANTLSSAPFTPVGSHDQVWSKLGIPRLASWGPRVSPTPDVRQTPLKAFLLLSIFIAYWL